MGIKQRREREKQEVRQGINLPEVEDAVEILRAFLHGLVCLHMENRLHGDEARVRRLVRRGIHGLLASWSSSPTD